MDVLPVADFVWLGWDNIARCNHVSDGSLADTAASLPNVRFTPESGHHGNPSSCPLSAKSGHRRRTSEMSAFSESGHLLRNCRHVSDTSIRIAFSAHGPHIRFALRYGLVHARASAGVRNSAPGEVGPLSTRCASATALGA